MNDGPLTASIILGLAIWGLFTTFMLVMMTLFHRAAKRSAEGWRSEYFRLFDDQSIPQSTLEKADKALTALYFLPDLRNRVISEIRDMGIVLFDSETIEDAPEWVTYNYKTIDRVIEALRRIGFNTQNRIEIVNTLESSGILFRERIKDSNGD